MPREKWTDDRLDDLKGTVEDGFARADKKMDDGFARVDTDIRELKGEMNRSSERSTRSSRRSTAASTNSTNALTD